MDDALFRLKFALKVTHPLRKTPTLTDTAYNVSTVKNSEKQVRAANRLKIKHKFVAHNNSKIRDITSIARCKSQQNVLTTGIKIKTFN